MAETIARRQRRRFGGGFAALAAVGLLAAGCGSEPTTTTATAAPAPAPAEAAAPPTAPATVETQPPQTAAPQEGEVKLRFSISASIGGTRYLKLKKELTPEERAMRTARGEDLTGTSDVLGQWVYEVHSEQLDNEHRGGRAESITVRDPNGVVTSRWAMTAETVDGCASANGARFNFHSDTKTLMRVIPPKTPGEGPTEVPITPAERGNVLAPDGFLEDFKASGLWLVSFDSVGEDLMVFGGNSGEIGTGQIQTVATALDAALRNNAFGICEGAPNP